MAAPSSLAEPAAVPVRVVDLFRRYGEGEAAVIALDGIDLAVEPSQVVTLMGPSGSGKSTLLHLLGAMDAPTSGAIFVGDWHVHELGRTEATRYRRTVGFVFQQFHLLGALSVLDNVLAPLLPLKLKGDPEPGARELLERVGLADRAKALPSELSGGQQQRVAIARALVNNPGLLLADEPTGNLDSSTGGEIIQLLLELRAERGTTVVIASHDPDIASAGDRIVHLLDGRIEGVDQQQP